MRGYTFLAVLFCVLNSLIGGFMRKCMQAFRIWALLWLTLSALQAQTLPYQVHGEGKTVLLLAEDHSKTSTKLIDELAAEQAFQVIVPDLHAYRQTAAEPDSLTLDRMATEVMSMATRLSRQPIAIVGCDEHVSTAAQHGSDGHSLVGQGLLALHERVAKLGTMT